MSTRSRVLEIFRKLHRTRKVVFEGDVRAIEAARLKINEEFKKNKDLTSTTEIEEQITVAVDCERLLRTTVAQAVKKEDSDVYELKIRKEMELADNVEFNDDADLPKTFTGKCEDHKHFL